MESLFNLLISIDSSLPNDEAVKLRRVGETMIVTNGDILTFKSHAEASLSDSSAKKVSRAIKKYLMTHLPPSRDELIIAIRSLISTRSKT